MSIDTGPAALASRHANVLRAKRMKVTPEERKKREREAKRKGKKVWVRVTTEPKKKGRAWVGRATFYYAKDRDEKKKSAILTFNGPTKLKIDGKKLKVTTEGESPYFYGDSERTKRRSQKREAKKAKRRSEKRAEREAAGGFGLLRFILSDDEMDSIRKEVRNPPVSNKAKQVTRESPEESKQFNNKLSSVKGTVTNLTNFVRDLKAEADKVQKEFEPPTEDSPQWELWLASGEDRKAYLKNLRREIRAGVKSYKSAKRIADDMQKTKDFQAAVEEKMKTGKGGLRASLLKVQNSAAIKHKRNIVRKLEAGDLKVPPRKKKKAPAKN